MLLSVYWLVSPAWVWSRDWYPLTPELSRKVGDWDHQKRQDLVGPKAERLRVTGNLAARRASRGHMVGPHMLGVTMWVQEARHPGWSMVSRRLAPP